MRIRKFFKTPAKDAFVAEIKKDIGPVIDKVRQPLVAKMKANPVKTFWIMFSIVLVNILILLLFTDVYSNKPINLAPYVKAVRTGSQKVQASTQDIPFSFENYRKMSALRDTLAIVMHKKKLTYEDTLTFVRLTEAFSKLDTSFKPLSVDQFKHK